MEAEESMDSDRMDPQRSSESNLGKFWRISTIYSHQADKVSEALFLELIDASRAKRLANIISEELQCKFYSEKEAIKQLTRNCGVNRDEFNAFGNFSTFSFLTIGGAR